MQGYLDFYNHRDNWLARCFTLEYAIWFRVVLLGVQKLGLPIPLGGTSVFFRRRRAGADRGLGRAQRHRGRRSRDASRPLRLPLRDDRLDHLGGGELPRPALDPPALALAQGLRRHLGDPHAPAAASSGATSGRAASSASRCFSSARITSYLSLPLFWALWAVGDGLGLGLLAELPGLADVELLRLDARRAGGDAGDRGRRRPRPRPAGAPAPGWRRCPSTGRSAPSPPGARSARSSPARATGTRPSTGSATEAAARVRRSDLRTLPRIITL